MVRPRPVVGPESALVGRRRRWSDDQAALRDRTRFSIPKGGPEWAFKKSPTSVSAAPQSSSAFAVARSSTLTLAAVWRLETRLKLCLDLTRHHGRAARSKSPRSPHRICCRGAPGARGSRRTPTSAHVERRAARLVLMVRRASAGIVATARRTAGARELPESRTAPRQPSISHQRPSPHAAAPRTALAPIPVDASPVTGARSTATPTLTRTSSSAPQSRRTAETVRNRCEAGASLAAVGTPTATRCD